MIAALLMVLSALSVVYAYHRGVRDGRREAFAEARKIHDMELEQVANWLLQGGVQ